MSRIAVTGQFSSAVSFSVFFSLSPYYLMAKAALPFLLAAEERKKGEMISSNPTAGREGGEEEEEWNDMSSVHDISWWGIGRFSIEV